MSLWGPGPEENDDAADWIAELEHEPSLFKLNEALDTVLALERDRYIEVSDGAAAAAAAAIVARFVDDGAHASFVGEECRGQLAGLWNDLAPGARHSLVQRAHRSLQALLVPTESELAELMSENPATGAAWRDHCARTLRALSL